MSIEKNKTPISTVNFVKHMRAVFDKFWTDDRLTVFHISIYIALFKTWNECRFVDIIRICRLDLMQLSKIGSRSKYAACLRDLHAWGYICYMPSNSYMRASCVKLFRFDMDERINPGETPSMGAINEPYLNPRRTHADTHTDEQRCKMETHGEPNEGLLYINILNNTNQTEREHTPAKKNENDILVTDPPVYPDPELDIPGEPNEKKITKGGGAGGRGSPLVHTADEDEAVPVSMNEVHEFFLQQRSTKREALKFFNYYTSNGWKVGRAAMKNWRAAACRWILNDLPTTNKKQTHATNFHVSTDKNYDEPL